MNRILVAALLALTAVSLVAQPTEDSTPPVCTVVTVEGQVEVARKGTAEWVPARPDQTLTPGDRVRTRLRSRATLRWSELSTVRVDQLTTLEVKPPASPEGKPELDLRSGASYFFSREKPTEIQFRTPAASGAIRGTEFNLAVNDEGETRLTLLDGEVDFTNAQGAVVLQRGEQGVAREGEPPRKTAMLDAASIIQWVLYYPAVVDAEELSLSAEVTQELSASLEAYRRGDLLEALSRYPGDRRPGSEAERIYLAALLLSVGQVEQAERELAALNDREMAAASALQELISVGRDVGECAFE